MTKNKLLRNIISCGESSTISLKANGGNPKKLGNTGLSPEATGYIASIGDTGTQPSRGSQPEQKASYGKT